MSVNRPNDQFIQKSVESGRIQLLSWKRLPARAAAAAGFLAFAICVVLGLWAGNTAITILVRAVCAMAICWMAAWLAGMLVVHAVRGDVNSEVSVMEPQLEHEEVQTNVMEMESMESAPV